MQALLRADLQSDLPPKAPELNEPCFRLFVAKVTMRQASRTLLCNRKSIRRRVLLLGDIGEATHGHFAPKRDEARFMAGTFLLDELETYATSRRNNPLTVPVLIHGESFFVVHTEVGLLPRRGGLGRDEAAPDPLSEAEDEARRRGSKAAVRACFERLQGGRAADRRGAHRDRLQVTLPGARARGLRRARRAHGDAVDGAARDRQPALQDQPHVRADARRHLAARARDVGGVSARGG
ncbi:MAG: hypothetical protein R3F49_23115 [Planctomycetota bacterium]